MLAQQSQASARWLRGSRQLQTSRTGSATSKTVLRRSPRSANYNASQQNAMIAQQTKIRRVEDMRAGCGIRSTIDYHIKDLMLLDIRGQKVKLT